MSRSAAFAELATDQVVLASTARVVGLLAASLVLIGIVLAVVGVRLVKDTRADHAALGPLEVLGDRSWYRHDRARRTHDLDKARPAGAEPVAAAAAVPAAPPLPIDTITVERKSEDEPAAADPQPPPPPQPGPLEPEPAPPLPDPVPEPTPHPSPLPDPVPEPQPHPVPEPDPLPEPTPHPAPVPEPEPEPIPEPGPAPIPAIPIAPVESAVTVEVDSDPGGDSGDGGHNDAD